MNLERETPSVVFNRAMAAVASYCERLQDAIGRRDAREALHAAQNAADLWRAGRSACRRLIAESSNQMSPYADAARRLMEEGYMTILGLIAIYVSTDPPVDALAEVQRLRDTLTKAMARPLVDGDAEPREVGTHSRLR